MDEPPCLGERELGAWRALLSTAATLNRLIEQRLKDDAGLSHSQYEVLVRLADAPGGELRMTELAGAATTSKSGLTYQVAQLEKAGLVRRRACPEDVRGIIASLTDEGWAKVRATEPGHAALVRDLFVDGLSRDDFTALAGGLEALRDLLHTRSGDQAS
ncbi:MarR family transcriptional regulator [Planotetraspora thailandica]|uniref:MarR family transcriptional regulator n=1 Tax=Planotetraspora thailandica TaxID=487172 RepID=A0A8J3XYI5_9ACTN|nr:MarR family transcriptional regulator [Planotetraspora thailandica]GII57261.1 MarR family transcriptional regulator [Planotetraspora thailandica]